ncbi:MAG TPA: hypothetical protein VFE41_20855 [Acetobacteraceae bacterium]|nr:hypothetical protein [Acetobacteraceae bacterium]
MGVDAFQNWSPLANPVWIGTGGATENMQDGETIEAEINQIGALRNPVVREA